MKSIKKQSFINYIVAIIIFLCFMLVSILVFFYCVQRSADKNTKELIVKSIEQQKAHFVSMIENQYTQLEGLSNYLGSSSDLTGEDNLRLVKNLCESGPFHQIAIITAEGMGYTCDGAVKDVSARGYFQRSMKGEPSVSDPLKSMIDGDHLVVLSVPIYNEQGQVIGVLGGAYDVIRLSEVLFEDIYDGHGYSVIITGAGQLVSIDESKRHAGRGKTFFEYYGEYTYKNDSSIDTIKEDFENQRGSCLQVSQGRDIRYMAYVPLEISDWMLCYVVPLKDAQASFAFIQRYELILSVVLAAGVVLLLLIIWRLNQKAHHSLVKKAQTDALTGLLNKESTEQEIDKWLKCEECEGLQALLMIDMDGFKDINDTYGHASGDEALRQTARFLKQEFRGSDIVGRVGGDEFIILMKNLRWEMVIERHMQEICKKCRQIAVKELKGRRLGCSIGAAYLPAHGRTFEELYRCADQALYKAKKAGKNGYAMYSSEEDSGNPLT